MKETKKKKPISNLANKYSQFIRNKISTRIHMSLILLSVSLTGTLISKLFLEFGMNTLYVRYFFTAILCYVFFLLYMKLWLLYINPGKNSKSTADNIDLTGLDLDVDVNLSSGSSFAGVIGEGGSFGGAGASSSFAGNISMPVTPSGSSGNLDLPDIGGALDIDGDAAAPILVVVAIGAVVIAIFGGAVFIIYQAPAIMSEAAFEALLTTGFLKSTRDISSGNWIGSIIKRTWIPFTIITIVATASGWVIGYFCPLATKIFDVGACI